MADAPPRWGEHWGNDWSQQRRGWDQWNRKSAPAPAPLPSYQRQYSGDRYPHQVEQQQALRNQNYRYQPRDAVVQQHYQAQPVQSPTAPGAARPGGSVAGQSFEAAGCSTCAARRRRPNTADRAALSSEARRFRIRGGRLRKGHPSVRRRGRSRARRTCLKARACRRRRNRYKDKGRASRRVTTRQGTAASRSQPGRVLADSSPTSDEATALHRARLAVRKAPAAIEGPACAPGTLGHCKSRHGSGCIARHRCPIQANKLSTTSARRSHRVPEPERRPGWR